MTMSLEDAEGLYGKTAADWLAKWDAGEIVNTIEMGGISPGYEQAIQITAAEMIREAIALGMSKDSPWEDEKEINLIWSQVRDKAGVNVVINNLGLSGAQFGAASNLAGNLLRYGPAGVMLHEAVKDRHILCSQHWPNATAK